jgi:hypothetical protein
MRLESCFYQISQLTHVQTTRIFELIRPSLGIGPDLAGMTMCELAGLYAYLVRLAASGR